METSFAAWLVKNESEVIVKELRKKNKAINKPKVTVTDCDNKVIVKFENCHRDLAANLITRYNGIFWADHTLHLTVKHIPSQKLVYVNINEL